jgi:hypothetical protein
VGDTRPRPIIVAQVAAVALTCVLVAASLAAVWLDKGVRFFEWREALGPLCLLVSIFDIVVIAWTIARERNEAVRDFAEREKR